jgi:hypothetical protein
MVRKFHIPHQAFRKIGKQVHGGLRKASNTVTKGADKLEKATKNVEKIARKVANVVNNPAVIAGIAAVAPEYIPIVAGAGLAANSIKKSAHDANKMAKHTAHVGETIHPDNMKNLAISSIQKAKPKEDNEINGFKFH